jgi:hypothetical protein
MAVEGAAGGGGLVANTWPRYAAISAIIASHVEAFFMYIGYSRSNKSVLPSVYVPGVVSAPVIRSGLFAPERTPPDGVFSNWSLRGSAPWQSEQVAGNDR